MRAVEPHGPRRGRRVRLAQFLARVGAGNGQAVAVPGLEYPRHWQQVEREARGLSRHEVFHVGLVEAVPGNARQRERRRRQPAVTRLQPAFADHGDGAAGRDVLEVGEHGTVLHAGRQPQVGDRVTRQFHVGGQRRARERQALVVLRAGRTEARAARADGLVVDLERLFARFGRAHAQAARAEESLDGMAGRDRPCIGRAPPRVHCLVMDARLLHDAVVGALEPVVEPAQRLGRHREILAVAMAPVADDQFRRLRQVGQRDERLGPEVVLPAGLDVDRHAGFAHRVAIRGDAALLPERRAGQRRNVAAVRHARPQVQQRRVARMVLDGLAQQDARVVAVDRDRGAQVLLDAGLRPGAPVGQHAAAPPAAVFIPVEAAREHGLQGRVGRRGQEVHRGVARIRATEHTDSALRPRLGGGPGGQVVGVARLGAVVVAAPRAERGAQAAPLDHHEHVAVAGQVDHLRGEPAGARPVVRVGRAAARRAGVQDDRVAPRRLRPVHVGGQAGAVRHRDVERAALDLMDGGRQRRAKPCGPGGVGRPGCQYQRAEHPLQCAAHRRCHCSLLLLLSFNAYTL